MVEHKGGGRRQESTQKHGDGVCYARHSEIMMCIYDIMNRLCLKVCFCLFQMRYAMRSMREQQNIGRHTEDMVPQNSQNRLFICLQTLTSS